ncbi:tripartite tricarboxylate transporter substrate binding protein [Achromobacter sp. GG226]|uniref:Bug family tripartite tricarboxylate transporter substrate binding protein n=1 Tax=Verticiella alkaliphila TaxID=2779529 RepID=UPI001C0D36D2|nr:tripartite tricarboxylate transporter substrate binding protein [Verticiella sp. GG226]MBU4609420.1 tripartite tricarboxylate transporter substrate binding protein [Verticiella sp. GG226]
MFTFAHHSFTSATLAAALCAAPLALAATPASAEYPERAIRMITPSGPGAITDQTARLVADELTHLLKQQVIVENKVGANGILASEYVARAKPDGYTLLFTYSATHTMNPWLIAKLPYDPVKDFTPVAQISGGSGNMLVVNGEVPVKTLDELVAYVKASPEELSYCSWGVGSGGHLTMEYLQSQRDLKMRHIPYKTATQCANDVAAGHVRIAFTDSISPLPHIRDGRVRPVAISGPSRVVSMPEVPTMTEQGLTFDNASWLGIFGPKGLPPEVVTRINEAVNTIIADPAKRERFLAMYLRPGQPRTPQQFGQLVKDDIVSWGKIVQTAGLKAE